mgnify:FL=1|tara:strand:- start:1072 stop:1329 length:258 start_codon:yes stop_codon:yes gene_type:complete
MTIFWLVVGSGLVAVAFYVVHLIKSGAVFKARFKDLMAGNKVRHVSDKMEKEHDEETESILNELNNSKSDSNISRVRAPHITKKS